MAGSPFTIDNHPTIRIRSPSHAFAARFSPSSASPPVPMAIPGSTSKSPPPPLPPPRYIEGFSDPSDPGWHFANRSATSNPDQPDSASSSVTSANVKSGSSLLGGHMRSLSNSYQGPKKNFDLGPPSAGASPASEHAAVDASDSANSDPRMPSLDAVLEYNKLQGENRLGQRSNVSSSHAYDKQVLSRIGGPRTPPRSAGGSDEQQQAQQQAQQSQQQPQHPGTPNSFKQLNGQLRPLSLPDRRTSEADQPRWTPNAGSASAFSPGLASAQSPMSEHPPDRKHHRQRTGSFTAAADGRSHHSRLIATLHEQAMFGDHESAVDDSPAHDAANHGDRSPSGDAAKTGQKRRAHSPPSETIDPNLRGGNDNTWAQRHAPVADRHGQPASLSSTASSGVSQSASHASSYAMSNPGTAATSYSSERPSPSSYPHSVAAMQPPSTPLSHQPPPVMQQAHTPSSNGALPMAHQRQVTSGMIRPPGVWICECCPKKPKKFESEQDLRNHESEKQYVCHYCHNRFKNKNEAERHQNSLHLRRHSWSCAALQSFENAFHPTTNPTLATAAAAHAAATSTNPPPYPPPAATDTCGYCGQEFSNPPDWDVRVEHLNIVHKFGECNQSKKFFRADHFRQHLKHSHAGTSGRWTNMLENACMREEAPPQPIQPQSVQQMQMGGMTLPMQSVSQPPPAAMQGVPQAAPPPAQMAPMMAPGGQSQSLGQRIEQGQQGGS